MKDVKRKFKKLYIFSFPICVIVGYVSGIIFAIYPTITKLQFSSINLHDYFWTTSTKYGLMIGIAIWILFVLTCVSRNKNMQPGKEYGEARFADADEINKRIAIDDTDKILSQHVRMGIDDRQTSLNASAAIIGSSGSGKSFKYITPNLLKANSSFVVVDPKGSIMRDTANYLQSKGYRVQVLNINNPCESMTFNPFELISSKSEIVKMVSSYIRNTTPKNSNESDPFWPNAEKMLMLSIYEFVYLMFPSEERGIDKVLLLLNEITIPDSLSEKTSFDKKIEELKVESVVIGKNLQTNTENIITLKDALDNYYAIRNSAPDTARSVLISAQARYNILAASDEIIRVLSSHSNCLDLRALGMGYNGHLQKTILYIVIPDIDKSFNGLISWLFDFLFRILYEAADFETDDFRLKIPLQIYWDEFANVAIPDNMLQVLATARSRFISINIFVQALSQLKGLFKSEYENIQGNVDTIIYLGSNEPSTQKSISEQLGKFTLYKQSFSNSLSINGSDSRSTDVLGKELLSQDRIRMLDFDKCIVMVRGCDPIVDEKCRTQDMPEYKLAKSLGPYKYSEQFSFDTFGALSNEEINHLLKQNIPPAIILNSEDIFSDEFFYEPSEPDALDIIVSLKNKTNSEKDSIKSRIMQYDFTPEQIAEVEAGIKQGLSEQQILSYFRIENSPERMRTLRSLF